MHLSGYVLAKWAFGFVDQLVLIAVLLIRRRYVRFPVFTASAFYGLARSITLFLIWRFVYHRTQHYYYYTQVWLGIVDEIIQLLVFYELASQVFCPSGEWAPDIRRAFLWLTGTSIVFAVLLAWLSTPPVIESIQSFVLRTNFLSSALMSELFVGILWLSTTAGLPWKTHVARIAQGVGAYSLACLILGTIINYLGFGRGTEAYRVIVEIRGDVGTVISLYWIATLWQEAPEPRQLPDAMRMQIYTLQRRVENDLIRIRNWRRS